MNNTNAVNTAPVQKKSLFKGRTIKTETFLLIVLFFLFVFFTITSPYFLTTSNISNLLKQTAINGIVAIGMVFVIISAGIDLSVGSVVGLSGMMVAMMLKAGFAIPFAVLVSVLVGTLLGIINGILIHNGKVPAFIATLGTMTVIRGIIMLISDAKMVAGLPKSFTGVAQLTVAGLPFLFIAWLLVILIAFVISRYTVFGRNMYAVGSNKEAARLSGINIQLTTYGIYAFCSFVCAIAGILMTARLGNGVPTGGTGYELDAIASAVVGGASLDGGEGTVIGTVLGAIIMATLRQGGNLLGINSFILEIMIGALIVVAVLVDKQRKK